MSHILLLTGFAICLLTKVDGRHSKVFRRSNDQESSMQNDGRGILGDIFNGILLPSNTVQAAPVNIPAPAFFPDQALAPTFQVPSNIPAQVITQRPSLLGGLINNIFNSNELTDNGYNQNWLNFALQKCARVDPKMLTAILPTTANGLRTPKMYYFQNDTSAKLTWVKAQEWCTARGMNLLTVNDGNENKVIIDRLRQIMASTAGGVVETNTNAFWIGLNNINAANTYNWIGDSTSTFTDWLTGEPAPTTATTCIAYNQVTTSDNIKMDAIACLTSPNIPLRFICEVSDECTSLFMSRFPTKYFHHPNNAHGHIHYSPGGVLPPV